MQALHGHSSSLTDTFPSFTADLFFAAEKDFPKALSDGSFGKQNLNNQENKILLMKIIKTKIMKKIIVIMSVMLIAGLSHAYADKGKDVNQDATASFSRDFASAKNISWQQEKQYAKVTFTINDRVMFAYYSNQNGELIAVVRNILSDQLPIGLMTSLKRNYSEFWISNLFEIAYDGQTGYYTTLENENEIVVLKSNGFNDWFVFKKEKKQ